MTHNCAPVSRFKAGTFFVTQLDFQLHDIIFITDFDIRDLVIIMGVRVLFCVPV